MHMPRLLPAVVSLALAASGSAFAQGNPRPQDEPGFRPYEGAPPQNLPPQQQRGAARGQRDQPDAYRGARNDNHGRDYRAPEYRGSGIAAPITAAKTAGAPAPSTAGIAAAACRPNTAAVSTWSTTGAVIT